MSFGFRFLPALRQRAHHPVTGMVLTLAVSMIPAASVLAQDKTLFSPEEGKLFLKNAADRARLKAPKTFEEFKKTVTKENPLSTVT